MSQVASSTMKADPTAATRALLALAQKQWEHQRDEADRVRRQAVLAAMNAGLSASEIGRAMGMTHSRVIQIANDTR